MTKRKKEKKT